MVNKDLKTITEQIIQKVGGISALAKALGETRAAVSNWKVRGRIPQDKVVKIEQLFNIPREKIRPDLKELFR